MFKNAINKLYVYLISIIGLFFCTELFAETNQMDEKKGVVIEQVFNQARSNDNWKSAFLTGKHAQIVFMNVAPSTNPTNEIGMEIHPFDQVILVVQGNGKAILSGKTWIINSGDLIFIPQGVHHNIINLTPNNASMKIISFYSSQDIPAKAVFPKKLDEKK